jgi:uncharacterized iron-regulated protein
LRKAWIAGTAALVLAGGAHAGPIDEGALSRLPVADVVILGEVHDNPAHHANQARAVAAVAPAALVFEMLTPDQARRTPADRSDAAAMDKAYGWNASGWPDFAMYHPIFTAAPDAAIYGGDLPAGEVRRALSVGAAQVFGPQADRYGLDRPLAPDLQSALERELDLAHCGALSPDILPGMAEAQRLRDGALARAVVRAMDETGGPVAVITGNGHARRDRGIPAVLALAAPELSVLSVGQIEAPAGAGQPFDLWLVTGTIDRGDPCAAFGIETRLRTPAAAMPG